LAANEAVIFAKADGNTMTTDVPIKLKHLSVQAAVARQSSMAFSHVFALCGQQSGISSVKEMPVATGDFTLTRAAGRTATETAIRSATMMRVMLMAGLARK
jgi:hypothetical protein